MLTFGIKDVLDIFLVALLLFYIYKLMKESSSANIFYGILIFVVVWIFVSQVFEMRLMGSIMDKLVNMGGLALIILFQEEIRHFFSTIGSQQNKPVCSIEKEYINSASGQLRTRFQAFVESVEIKKIQEGK